MAPDADRRWVDTMPAAYDRGLGPVLFAPVAREIAGRAAAAAPQRVLELAAGTGILTAALRASLPEADLVATDLNEAMVAFGSGAVPGATWRQADALDLPFPDDRFDLVVHQLGVMFFPDRVRAFRETARVLRTGGRLLFCAWDAVAEMPLVVALVQALDSVLGPGRSRFVTEVPHGYHDPAVVRAEVEAAGLRVDAADAVRLPTSGTTDDLARGFCLGSPVRATVEEAGADPEAAAVAVGDAVARLLGGHRFEAELALHVYEACAP